MHCIRRLPISLLAALAVIFAGAVYIIYKISKTEQPYPGIPVVSLNETSWRWPWEPAYSSWIKDAKRIVAKGAAECPSCFQVLTASGYKIVVPNRFADELKNLPHLSFNEALAPDLMVNYPGFDGHRESLKSGTFIQEVTRIKLTQSLGLITDDLVEESRDAIHEHFGDSPEWQNRYLKDDLVDLVARLSSRVFLGKDLCRNKTLMKLFKDHTTDISVAMSQLQKCPALIRPIVYWFIPSCTRLRRQVRDISSMILPEVEKRIKRVEDAARRGDKPTKAVDSIAWMVEVAKGRPINYVAGQLALSFAAIHMTADSFCKCFMQICQTPDVVNPLRTEIKQILKENGWSRLTIYKFWFMDSFLKEVQRLNGMSSINMIRMVKKPTMLSDGTLLPIGSRIMILDNKVTDPEVFPDPTKFLADRFLNMRLRPGEEHRHQFVTLTHEQLGFGLGTHACPGRFFAANEIKIAMCFMLLKYDFRHVPGMEPPKMVEFDMFRMCDPSLQIQIRRRLESNDEEVL
ncbi:hypothetical protein M433DRAFT_4754 [Acidomyces richmondensis BFW]|nr:MAG: hypothetical protein FE78DRAFT_145302 [Acidomyces sp. 'richmondensis']KYG45261.1 hypothetical protein M433DRAFT_4754 [Acidomyces richmondensis BFW]